MLVPQPALCRVGKTWSEYLRSRELVVYNLFMSLAYKVGTYGNYY